ncbi:MAG: hypothetical protein IJ343_02775 [Clostridia bacterium]|nr:hypothetical protein [Clostridia bacterium]
MKLAYEKVLLDQMRLVIYSKNDTPADDQAIARAVTVNEYLQSIGFTLTAADILRLASSESLTGFCSYVANMIDDVKAKPMYPDFPRQVMNMTEAQYRLHQLVHYFSTYGLESLLGVKVSRGWLPDVKSTEKTREDDRLLKAKTLELIAEEDKWREPARRILMKRERMTLPEVEIVTEAIRHLDEQSLTAMEVPFKENLMLLAEEIWNRFEGQEAQNLLRALLKHTGDVLNFIILLLGRNKYHFRTSQKRMLVGLIERYPVADWRANIILSNKKATRNNTILNYLDYGSYSRSKPHMAVVDDLRDGKLKSWEGQARALLSNHEDGALEFIAKRPGMMLRMVAWMLRLGYDKEQLIQAMCENAASLSVQTLVTVLACFGMDHVETARMHRENNDLINAEVQEEAQEIFEVLEAVLSRRLSLMDTELRGKKVFVNEEGYNLGRSAIMCSNKSEEGGYVSSGSVYRIPYEAKYVRFFVYWNDRQRIDVDLHAAYYDLQGAEHEIGWNSDFRNDGIVMSGDITHSNAAEYIDVDLSAPITNVAFNIHLYSGKDNFGEIDTCFAGLMLVKDNDEDVALYTPANCLYSTHLRSRCDTMRFGYLDVPNRCLVFQGKPIDDAWWYDASEFDAGRMHTARYLELLLAAQGCERVASMDEAEISLVIGKPNSADEISLIDNNYFMDAPLKAE